MQHLAGSLACSNLRQSRCLAQEKALLPIWNLSRRRFPNRCGARWLDETSHSPFIKQFRKRFIKLEPWSDTMGAAAKTVESSTQLSDQALACLRSLAARYVWWKTPDEAMQFPSRVAAQ